MMVLVMYANTKLVINKVTVIIYISIKECYLCK